ncbi:MAG: shikimate kinase, partial [Gemmatimonadetes bacterium]|nr:shikimate kinase [Gemmatimonadota bacterium]
SGQIRRGLAFRGAAKFRELHLTSEKTRLWRTVKASGARRVLLVGFMGSGKSSVGRKLASQLGWRFEDVDEVITRESGMSVPEIFENSGEPFFRDEEHRRTQQALKKVGVVIATGGGWATVPARLDEVPNGTVTIWLSVSPEEVIRRVGDLKGIRPLLGCADPLEKARDLLEQRSDSYSRAEHKVDTDGFSVEDVSVRILEILQANNLRNGME